MTAAEKAARLLADVKSARSETAVFVRMDGRFAVVNIGTSTVTVPCVGFYPPVVGMPVRVDWVDGSPSVTGPVHPLDPVGTITATGSPRATVDVGGVEYTLFYRDGYSPVIGDAVEINWATGIIQGKVTGIETPDPVEEHESGSSPFDVTVRASDSGRYQAGSGWWGKGPWASSSNDGIWVYGNRVKDAVGGGTVTTCQVFLPLVQQVGLASIGAHDHPSIPGGGPSIHSLSVLPLGGRSGWVTVPTSVGQYLAAGGRGVGVLAPGGNGYNMWRGVDEDSLSGAVRLTGYR